MMLMNIHEGFISSYRNIPNVDVVINEDFKYLGTH